MGLGFTAVTVRRVLEVTEGAGDCRYIAHVPVSNFGICGHLQCLGGCGKEFSLPKCATAHSHAEDFGDTIQIPFLVWDSRPDRTF